MHLRSSAETAPSAITISQFQISRYSSFIPTVCDRRDFDVFICLDILESKVCSMANENAQKSVMVLRQDAPSVNVHWLPCAIDHTGEAPVAAYFLPHVSETGETFGPPR